MYSIKSLYTWQILTDSDKAKKRLAYEVQAVNATLVVTLQRPGIWNYKQDLLWHQSYLLLDDEDI